MSPQFPLNTFGRTLCIAVLVGPMTALPSLPAAAQTKKVAVTMIVEVPQLLDVKRGLMEELARSGYTEGKNLAVEYQQASGQFPTAQQIAKRFAGEKPDVIVPITTPSAITVVQAAKDENIPVVFSTVTDPLGAKIVQTLVKPGGNVTGVSDMAPIDQHFDLIRKLAPGAKRLGVLMNPSLANTQFYLAEIKKVAPAMGWTVVESPANKSTDVQAATLNLVGKVDAIYIPNDTTVYSALEAAVKVANENKLPLFCGETRSVGRGCLASISFDYYDVGVATAQIVKQVLDGRSPGTIDVNVLKDSYKKFELHINSASAAAIGMTVPEALLKSAKKIY